MQQHGSKFFALRHPPRLPTLGVKLSNSTFSEPGLVAYQVMGSCECSIMVANISPADPHLPEPWCLNATFSEHCHVAYQIKGNHE